MPSGLKRRIREGELLRVLWRGVEPRGPGLDSPWLHGARRGRAGAGRVSVDLAGEPIPAAAAASQPQLFRADRLALAALLVEHMHAEGWTPYWCHHCDRLHALRYAAQNPHGLSPAMQLGLAVLAPEILEVLRMRARPRS